MSEEIRKVDENILMSSPKFAKQRAYWLNTLTDHMNVTEIPADGHVFNPGSREGTGETGIGFPEEMCRRLIKFSKNSDLSLYIILLTAVELLIYRYTGNQDIIVVSPLYKPNINRDTINHYLLIRVPFPGDFSFIELLLKTRQAVLEAYENQDYPFYKLIEHLYDGEYPLPESSFSQVSCSLKNIHGETDGNTPGTKLHFSFRWEEGQIGANLLYHPGIYSRHCANRLATYLVRIVESVLDDVKQAGSDISFLSEEEKKRVICDFNRTEAVFSGDKTISRLFDEQVEKTPDAIAVIYENHHFTYLALKAKANQLANQLRAKGVTPGSIVALIVDRSIEMIVGILGILKAGGAYLPINPEYPEERILLVLQDAGASILITVNRVVKEYSFTKLQNLQAGDRKIYLTADRPIIKDLDRLPMPNMSLVDYEKYNRYIGQSLVKNNIALLGTRGCPYNCAFCHKIWPKTHVVHSAEYLFQEVKFYYDLGVKRFTFLDDVFNVNGKNSQRFLELIIENGLDLQFFLCMRGDILTREYIDLMVRAGTVRIALALETASPRLQELIGKRLNLQRFRENIEYLCEKYPNVILELNTIHGFPTETEGEAIMTLEFIKTLKWVHFPYVHVLKIYPNTEMEKLALKCGISWQAIVDSSDLAYHELPSTLPFDKSFTLKYQAEFFNEYFISKERLLHVLPYQMEVLTEDEIIQKYDSYLPVEIRTFDDLLQFTGISRQKLRVNSCRAENSVAVPGLNKKLDRYFSTPVPSEKALRVLLLDLSQFFTHESENMLYDVVEPPLGLIYLMTVLNRQYGERVMGKIAKSRIDFDNYRELRFLVEDFKPNVIGIRTLTFYRRFFHRTIANLRQWGIDVPIIAGGPYATSDYAAILQDKNLDLAVLGEGEVTFSEVIGKIMENNGKLPGKEILKGIAGLAFPGAEPGTFPSSGISTREVVLLDAMETVHLDSDPSHVNHPCHPAYVIFTSGSTGRPKGVMIEHRGVDNLVQALKEAIYRHYDGKPRVCMVSPYEFDASVKQLFTALLLGYPLHLVPEDTRLDGFGLLEFYRKYQVDISDGTPAHLRILLESLGENTAPPPVREFIIGGEALSSQVVERFFAAYGDSGLKITNVYGPTECCDVATCCAITPGTFKPYDPIPIGRPLANVRAYILGPRGELQPIGAPGELQIAGVGVASGYLNNPELTAEKFKRAAISRSSLVIRNLKRAFNSDPSNKFFPNERLYKTGDLSRWRSDGNIEFLGRVDFQVKVRGFRIELEEIEHRLLEYEGIREALVIDKNNENGNGYLCAYIISINKIPAQELREYFLRKLPEYMVPRYFVFLEEIPLTPNGKVNRRALPDPDKKTGGNYIAPRNEIEEKLVEIWSTVLSIEKDTIGIDSNFFELGGDSLKATILVVKLHKEFDVKIPITKLFKTSSIRELASLIGLIEWAENQKAGTEHESEEIVI